MEADDVEQKALFILVVMIEVGLGHAAGFRDLVHRRAVVTVRREKLRGAIEDRLSFVVVVVGAAAGHETSYSFGLLSMTRLALPTERSILPGSSTVTRAVMPMVSLTDKASCFVAASRAGKLASGRASTWISILSMRPSR